jgi:sugar diacid utilization regulator
METAWDSSDPLTSLVRVAVHSDDPAELIAAASLLARQPLALVGAHGEPLGYAPDGAEGRRALAVARAAACNRLVGAAGWSIVPITRGGSSLGFLAIGAERSTSGAATPALMDTLPELVAEQLHRVALLRAHREAFVRRLVSDPRFDGQEAREEAGDLGLGLADAYWPAILTWHRATPPPLVAERLARDALGRAEGSLTALLHRRIVLLYPSRAGDPGAERREPFAWLEQIVAEAMTLAPSFPAQAIAGEAAVELAGVSAEVAELDALRRLGSGGGGEEGRGLASGDTSPVVSPREYALQSLLWENVDAATARRFVDEQLGRLTAWDREHRSDLLSVLEAALDFPRHDQAASRCYMHRNTFRHRLRQAHEVLGTTLEDPDVRLAVHVALRLRRLLAASSLDDGSAVPRAAPSANGRRSKRRSAGSAHARATRSLSRRA